MRVADRFDHSREDAQAVTERKGRRAEGGDQAHAGGSEHEALTPEQERLRSYLQTVEGVPIPSAGEEEELVQKIELFGQEGFLARRRLAQGYFRLVVSLAAKRLGRQVRYLDLIEAGNQALTSAVERYDYNSGVKFADYATWMIESALELVGSEEQGVQPASGPRQDIIDELREICDHLSEEKGREPTEREIARAMGIEVDELRQLLDQDLS